MENTSCYPIRPVVRIAGLAASVAAAACQAPDPAPRDLDALVHRFWLGFEEDEDADMQEALRAFEEITDEAALLESHQEAEPTRLTEAETALSRITTEPRPDPAAARGLIVTTRYACARPKLEEILVFPDQNALYEVYDAYERRFDTDRAPFLNEDVARIGWDGTITTSIPLSGTYTYDFRTELRRVPMPADFGEAGDAVAPAGESAILARTYMTEAAVWSREGPSFPQDYQIEVYIPLVGEDGVDIVHLASVWRELNTDALGDMEDDIVVRTTVGQMKLWDTKTEKWCAEPLPSP